MADARQWYDALKELAGSDVDNPAMAQDAISRSRAGVLTVRDMRLVLLATADTPVWARARQTVMDDLALHPERARQVLATHTQVEVWPSLQFETDDHPARKTAAAVIGPAGAEVTGPVQSAPTSREAKDRAALALLARLVGVFLPGEPAEQAPPGRLVLPVMPTEVFGQRLRRQVEAGQGPGAELEEEVLQRARASRLRHHDLYLLLLVARGEAWTAAREAALDRAVAMPPAPARLLHWHAEQYGEDYGLTYQEDPVDEHGRHHTRARFTTPEETCLGPRRSGTARKAARHQAAGALLAQLAGLPEPAPPNDDKPSPTPKITVPDKHQDPVKRLDKLRQLDLITKPEANVRKRGPRVEVTYTCRHLATGTTVNAAAFGPDKVLARHAAALALLRKLHTLDTDHAVPASGARNEPRAGHPDPDTTVPAPPPDEHDRRTVLDVKDLQPRDVLLEAITSGCDVAFVPARAGSANAWRVRDNGRRALPMTGLPHPLLADPRPDGEDGWHVPLLDGLPALRESHPAASATATFWQRALHISLQLIAARLVYPAHTEDGLAAWRIGPLPPHAEHALAVLASAAPTGAAPPGTPARRALAEAGDAIADALIRTPAAGALFSTSPWTHPAPMPVAAADERAVRRWLDDIEEQVDDGPAPLLLLRIETPTDDQATTGRLAAELYLAPAEADTPPAASPDPVPATHLPGTAHLPGQPPDKARPRTRRVLRRAARLCPALAGLATEPRPGRCTLHPGAVDALLEQEAELHALGVRLEWPPDLRTALATAAVVGTEPLTSPAGNPPTGEAPRFSVSALLDFRWQIALDGTALTAAEMDALAEAARPLVRLRGRWVLADAALRRLARNPLLGQIPGTQALTAALTGTITVDGTQVPCRTAGHLARLIDVLTSGEHHPETVPAPHGLRATLRGYQQRALTWLAHTTRLGFGAVLADDMGLGKTLTALAFTLHHQQHTPGPTLVICPASLIATWCREAERFTPGLPVLPFHGPDRTLDDITDTTVVVTTYGLLRRDHTRLAGRTWSLVIADEAQHAKNHTSATARRLRALPSTTRLALTGTPVENNLSELWALLDWANPDLFGTAKTFRARWANAAEKDPHGEEALELGRVVAPFLLRRRKTDPGIAPELPAKIDQPRLVRLTTEQATLYEAVVRETLQQIQTSHGITRNGLVFKLITALKKITNHPAHYLTEDATTAGTTEFTGRSGKTAALVDLLDTIRTRSEATLIFTSYVPMGHLLHRHLHQHGHDPLYLHGATPLPERQRMVDAFQAGRHPVMILSLKAAGTGLTLTRAAHVIHYDRSWNAAVEDQATDRAHRIGQQQTVTVHRLITEHTIEDRIDELLTHKRALAAAVLTGGGDRAFANLTDRELAELVNLGAHR
ncbi:SNF2-related protein [Streptomyces albidoflavus]|uniref:SNF2-related protein n=1 Tax=Streptomyces albidoflavus TaxID=1886 RepID=UPI003D09B8B7